MDGSKSSPVDSTKPDVVEREMHLVMTGRVASHTIGLNGATQNIDVVEIGTSTIDKAISAAGRDIDNIGMVSMDSLFCPYVIGMNWADHASLPHWEEPVAGAVTATDLNPFNPAMAMTSATVFYNTGPNLGIYNSVETLGEGDFCQFKNVNENDLRLNSVKGVGLKTPIILTGWGYDTNDQPVPADTANPDIFASDAFRNPSLWKSGPLDVRWDDDRKVWTGGGGGGGGHTIWFTIADVLCPESDYTSETTLVAVPTYYNQGCDAIPPGAEYDGTYLVYDICNYLSGLTPADMLMTTGRATYMYPMTGACEPRWIIDDLCAQPECV